MEFTFFPLLFIVKPVLMYQMGGMQAVCWTCAFPLVWGYHTTFLVNSASHIWGTRPFETGKHAVVALTQAQRHTRAQ
jgi:stearoyl-CoA desaturase (delta-9 desaturase)